MPSLRFRAGFALDFHVGQGMAKTKSEHYHLLGGDSAMGDWQDELREKLKEREESDGAATTAFNNRQKIVAAGAAGLWDSVRDSLASAITKINGTSKYLTATRDSYSSDITVTYERKRNSKSGWLRWDGTNQALTVFVLGSVAEKKYPVVADPATEKAAFEHSRKTVTPEDVVRDFLQELTGV